MPTESLKRTKMFGKFYNCCLSSKIVKEKELGGITSLARDRGNFVDKSCMQLKEI